MNSLIRVLCLLGTFGILNSLPSTALAAWCSSYYIMSFQGPTSISFDPSVAIGTTLWSGSMSSLQSQAGSCWPGSYTVNFQGSRSYLGSNLYESGVAGIGYRLKASSSNFCYKNWWPGSCTSKWTGKMGQHTLQVELVKTGNITSSGVLSGQFGSWTIGGETFAIYYWSGTVAVKPNVPTCKISTPLVSVPLGAYSINTFAGAIGSGTTLVGFNVALQCSGASGAGAVNVYATLTDQTNAANRSGVLSLTPASTAKGIGIEVRFKYVILNFGPDSNKVGNLNQWLTGSAANGVYDIPLAARYVKTSNTVTPGTANGRATITMSYQ